MSYSPREFDVWETWDFLPQRIFDDILVVANSLLRDECPIAKSEEWLFPFNGSVIQLKMWGKTVGVERGMLEKIVPDKHLCFAIGLLLSDVLKPLRDIEGLCEDTESDKSPDIKARYVGHNNTWIFMSIRELLHTLLTTGLRILAAIDEYQTSIERLTGSVELFRDYETNLNNRVVLQRNKLVRSAALCIVTVPARFLT